MYIRGFNKNTAVPVFQRCEKSDTSPARRHKVMRLWLLCTIITDGRGRGSLPATAWSTTHCALVSRFRLANHQKLGARGAGSCARARATPRACKRYGMHHTWRIVAAGLTLACTCVCCDKHACAHGIHICIHNIAHLFKGAYTYIYAW